MGKREPAPTVLETGNDNIEMSKSRYDRLIMALSLLLDNAETDALNESEHDNPDLHKGIEMAREFIPE